MKVKMTPTQYQQFSSTFLHMRTLYRERAQIARIKSEKERLSLMNTLASASGVEEGFATGEKSSEFNRSLVEKVNILLLTYQHLKNKEELDKMIHALSTGDGCLTARMGRVVDLYSTIQLGAIEETTSAEKIKETPIYTLNEIFQEWASELIDTEAREFLNAINTKEPEEKVIKCLKDYATGEAGLPFREFLAEQEFLSIKDGNIPEANEINWKEILPWVLKNKNKIERFVEGKSPGDFNADKNQRFLVRAQEFINQLTLENLEGDKLEEIGEKFQMYCSGELTLPFRKFLVDKKIVSDSAHINWEQAVLSMLKLPEFASWLKAAKNQAVNELAL